MEKGWLRLLGSLLSCVILIEFSAADCECGYSITAGDAQGPQVFTDLLESDFVHINYVGKESGQRGWATQTFNKSAVRARGSYGESFAASGLEGNLIEDVNIWTADGAGGGGAGLELLVNSEVMDGMVQAGQVATLDGDYFHGSYRTSMKVTAVEGTCTAFFWYFNDTQEIDLEFLSREFNHSNSSYPVNLVLQTPQSQAAGYDATKTGTFVKAHLPFDPSEDFHEYRFDFLNSQVLFYADDILLASMNDSTGGVPTSSGNLILSHWSNGNINWSGGPPSADAVSVVRYVKAYYNSSSEARQNDYETRCTDSARQGAVCTVPEGNATFFFMYETNMTVNQSTSGLGSSGGDDESGTGSKKTTIGSTMALCIALLAVMWVSGL